MNKKLAHILTNEYIILSLIILGAFLVRLYKINIPLADWHSFRQADTASVSRVYVDDGTNILFPRYYDLSSIQSGISNLKGYRFVEFPIYNVLHAFLYKSIPILSLEVWGRLLSVFCSLISTIFIYLIGKRFIGSFGGICAACFFAFLPYNIFYSRVILPEPMATMFGLASIWYFIRFIDKEKVNYLLFSGALFALALLIKPYTVFYSVPLIYLVIDKYNFKGMVNTPRLFVSLMIFAAISVIPLLLWRMWIGQYPQGIPFFKWVFNGDGIRFRPAFWRWIFGERIGILILGVWGIFPFLAGLIARNKKYFIQLFFLGQLLYLSIIATANVKHDYYQVFIIPAVALLLGQGISFMVKSKEINQWILRPVLFFTFFLMFGISFYKVKEYYLINHPEIITAGEAVDRLTSKDAWVIAPYNGDTAFLYQTKRYGWPAVDDSFANIIKKGADYYVSVNLGDTDTKYILENFMTVEKTGNYVIADLHKPIKQ